MTAIDPQTMPEGWLTGAPTAVIEAFTDWREGRLTWVELREHIDRLGDTDPAIKTYRAAKLSPLDRSNG
ncbi:hypothetical protein [Mesorhizobium sp. M0276]|uniref:hypothetical protein n=1 Tax=Mesorhizobium sp. M0276 TaxID=2956928 RepID=UPI003339B8BE